MHVVPVPVLDLTEFQGIRAHFSLVFLRFAQKKRHPRGVV
jgi:hypothetical protein